MFVGGANQFDDSGMLCLSDKDRGAGFLKEITLKAELTRLDEVIEFLNKELEAENCSMFTILQMDIAVEELFVNIASYAYNPEEGAVTIQVVFEYDMVHVIFIDSGRPYNPWEKKDPDTTLNAEERKVGGLGIYMVKKSMSYVDYSYADGKNILTIKKNIRKDV